MEVAKIIVAVFQLIASIVLIAVIMFQSGKESGLSGALSGKNDTYLSKIGGLDKKLAAATKWIALVWGVFTLALCILNAI
jgi:preprotein translocase subunit SecG